MNARASRQRFLRPGAVLSVALLSSLLCTCALFTSRSTRGSVTVTASMEGLGATASSLAMSVTAGDSAGKAAARTMTPSSISLATIYYSATLTPPDSKDTARSVVLSTASSFSWTYLEAGNWTLAMTAYADDKTTAIGSGSVTVTVTGGETTSATVDLSPPSGSGEFGFYFDWTTASAALTIPATYTPTLSLTPLTTSDASTADVALSVSEISATEYSYSASSIAAGFYRLVASLTATGGTRAAWTTREIVYIFPGAATVYTLTVSSLSSIPEAFTALTAKRAHSVTTGSYSAVVLSWYGAGGATSFVIARAEATSASGLDALADADYTTVVTVSSADAGGYVDSTATALAHYYRYRVTAANMYGSNAPATADAAPVQNVSVSLGNAVANMALAIMGATTSTAPTTSLAASSGRDGELFLSRHGGRRKRDAYERYLVRGRHCDSEFLKQVRSHVGRHSARHDHHLGPLFLQRRDPYHCLRGHLPGIRLLGIAQRDRDEGRGGQRQVVIPRGPDRFFEPSYRLGRHHLYR